VTLAHCQGTGDLLHASDDTGNRGQSGNDGGKGSRDFTSDIEDASKAELLLFGSFFGKIHF